MLIQDALRVLLMGIPQPSTAHVHIAGWEVVPGWGRRHLVTRPQWARRQVTILAFFLLWRQGSIVITSPTYISPTRENTRMKTGRAMCLVQEVRTEAPLLKMQPDHKRHLTPRC
jgi:hypothetical protein